MSGRIIGGDYVDGDKIAGDVHYSSNISVGDITDSVGVQIGTGTNSECQHLSLIAIGERTYCKICKAKVIVVIDG